MPWHDRDDLICQVVINHQEVYSVMPVGWELPVGWKAVGKTGTKQECIDYINEVWTDFRPRWVREKMEEDERRESES